MDYCRQATKGNNFFLKFYPCLPYENNKRKLLEGARDASLELLSTCLLITEFRFYTMLYSIMGNENLRRSILNVHAGNMLPSCDRLLLTFTLLLPTVVAYKSWG